MSLGRLSLTSSDSKSLTCQRNDPQLLGTVGIPRPNCDTQQNYNSWRYDVQQSLDVSGGANRICVAELPPHFMKSSWRNSIRLEFCSGT
ncbi:unnamed protein product [Diplocarpon coronariae]